MLKEVRMERREKRLSVQPSRILFTGRADKNTEKRRGSLGVVSNHPQEDVSAPHLNSINGNNAYNHFTMSLSRALT